MEGPEITFAEAVIDNGSFGKRTVRFETGRLAKQAAGAVVCYLDDDTTLLSTTAAGKSPKDHFDFFPLTVDVEERMYAAGKIPGSFFRREGRPSTDAILTCRLIDRPLRPAFVKGLRNEVQVVITVLSLNPDHQYDVLAINGASASTQISGLPFSGPIGATRMSLIDGQWVAFPNFSDIERSTFDMVVAGRIVGDDVAIMMVEAESTESTWDLVTNQGKQAPTEEVVAQGLEESKKFIRVLCEAQQELAGQAAKEVQEFPLFLDYEDDAYQAVEQASEGKLRELLSIADKQDRESQLDAYKDELKADLAGEGTSFEGREKEISAAYRAVQKKLVRERILREQVRIDGRGPKDIRALSAEVEVLPRVHGSAIFERGETQILGVTTLNMLRMEQQLDTLSPVTRKRYMHNYNFPPYSTGETGRVGSPKRREVGHGALAERALVPVLPTREEFPYAIRQVSEALSSNGSTSMGSVCASTLSLLNAGVPLRAPVAGIAMGLVSAEIDGATQYLALTDILGAEDAFGDMDFKVAGTREFVTAIQLDTKLDGIPATELATALTQAHDARMHILDVMNEAIDAPDEMSPYAPRVIAVKVPVDKIGEVIGPKGKMINQIQEDTGADISIEDDGTVYIGATDGPSAEAARAAINAIANPQMPEVGERFLGTVVKTTTFGAFVSLLPGKDGLLHISEVRKLVGGKRIDAVEDVLGVGQKVQVELKEIDPRGKLSLAVVQDESAAQGEGDAAAPAQDQAPAGDAQESGESDDSDGSGASADSGESGESGDKPRRERSRDDEGGERPRRRRRGGRGRGRGEGNGEGNVSADDSADDSDRPAVSSDDVEPGSEPANVGGASSEDA
ncbi:polyribonucleotide nucleotidyltransferase [Barrientosiimonas humi]|uniref:Polyribonucleotide nucleotidyltransferase n=1 Tax=Barrientosiimonas humi TaxID=999931 RepID=A0A542XA03_9MICO|nr:polyribonucleotide nucleotidyltransferase [Barrientosiimonas humi]TQL32651.1 polyribonucleotide nucleotidyltransferase [Barrientosiimonas humi]CAG7572642.1 Polyribonucleotide nucleotidyltransferase [Barrientosiimonas humi]